MGGNPLFTPEERAIAKELVAVAARRAEQKWAAICRSMDGRRKAVEYGEPRPFVHNGRKHGTNGSYSNGCRCPECKAARQIYWKARRKKRHGTFREYSKHGCRCEKCKQANTDRCREARYRKKGQQ